MAEVEFVRSADGTTIAFERTGTGPAVINVDGALTVRGAKAELADLLAPRYQVYRYDRRGRGDSTDTEPYSVAREIEDIAALIDAAGEPAHLFGHSSGGALALDAALALGDKVRSLAIYEVPYDDDPQIRQGWHDYLETMATALSENRPGDAVKAFMASLGMPAEQIEAAANSPFWPGMEAVGHTLTYDHTAILGPDRAVPVVRAARLRQPALILYGTASYPFMQQTAQTLAAAIPDATLQALDGESHEVAPAVIAPVLASFFDQVGNKAE